MRSAHADEFNHDEDAPDYDDDVRDEAHPIRAGYEALLAWVIDTAGPGSGDRVLDLGSGTGNLSHRIRACRELVCVDLSREMSALARPKLAHLPAVRFEIGDLLEFFDVPREPFDVVISTYAIHHLVEAEKQALFGLVRDALAPGGRAVFGDLMLPTASELPATVERYRTGGHEDTADALEEEFFWFVDSAVAGLEALDLQVESVRFSDLSWGISARRA